MSYGRDYPPAAYGGDYLRDLRWPYPRRYYGRGTWSEPYWGGGVYGVGYDWASDRPPDLREPGRGYRPAGPRRFRGRRALQRGAPSARYRGEHVPPVPSSRRAERGRYEEAREKPPYRRRPLYRRPGTAARDYDRAYPYFSSAGAAEAAMGYPPGDTLNPDAYPRGLPPDATSGGEID